MTELKLYAPSYYNDFACIADQCKHSCCVGWEIDVDPATLEKYKSLESGYGARIRESIEEGDAPHFRLCADERCPHLDGRGLCKIILSVGEDYLCDICREHPRFYHETPDGEEVGLGMACEEACRLILTARDFTAVAPIDGTTPEGERFSTRLPRDRMLSILADESRPYAERLRTLEETWRVFPALLKDAEAREILQDLEYLYPEHRARFSAYTAWHSSDASIDAMLCRALAYFIFRHVSPVLEEDEVRAALGFSLFCERLLSSVATAEGIRTLDGMIDLARSVSEELEYSEKNTDAIKEEFLFRI